MQPTEWLVLGGLTIAVVLVFLPVLTETYLYHDDWPHRLAQPFRFRSTPTFLHMVLIGRPVAAGYTFALFSLFQDVEGAWIARLANLAVLVAATLLLCRIVRDSGISMIASASIAFAAICLPAPLIAGYWLGACCLGAAYLLALAALRSQQTAHGKGHGFRHIVLGTISLALAFAAHQQAAMIFWAGAVALIALSPGGAGRQIAGHAAIGLAGTILYLAGYLILTRVVAPEAHAAVQAMAPERSQFFTDLPGGLLWYAEAVLPRAASLWIDDRTWPWAWSGLAATAGLLSAVTISRAGKGRLFRLLGLVVGLAVLGAPTIVSGFRLEAYRIAWAGSFLILLTILLPIARMRFAAILLPLIAVAIGIVAGHRLRADMIAPAVRETAVLIDASLRTSAATGPVVVLLPEPGPDRRTDEFGLISSGYVDNLRDALTVLRRQRGLGPIAVRTADGADGVPAASVIDLRPLGPAQ